LIKSIALVADAYPPLRTSAAIQIRDLAIEFLKHGVVPTVITSDAGLRDLSSLSVLDGITVLRLKVPKHKNIGKIRRAMAEFLMPFFMIRNFRKSCLKSVKWDAVIWYSPTIFLGPFVSYLKRTNSCPSYLILRDIFPAWAHDLGLIGKSPPYYFFKLFEFYQYLIADCIGVQSAGNLRYFNTWNSYFNKKTEVLQNWLSPKSPTHCSISISLLPIANRKIFLYAGNMGISQSIGDLLVLAEEMLPRSDIGFLFIGQGRDVDFLKGEANSKCLTNTVFCNEIDADEMPGLYAQCHIGLIALDRRHKTHNIPGKFLSYLLAGMPVLAVINDGNDLQEIIEVHRVGRVTTDRSRENLRLMANSLIDDLSSKNSEVSLNCKKLASELFSSKAAVEKIMGSLISLK
jgi:hypothetical protein